MRVITICFILLLSLTAILPISKSGVIYAEYTMEHCIVDEDDLIELIIKDKDSDEFDTLIYIPKAELRNNPDQIAFKSIIDSLAADPRPMCYLISFLSLPDKEYANLVVFENVPYTDYIDSIKAGNYSVYRHYKDGKIKKDFIIKFNKDSISESFPGKLFLNTNLSNKIRVKKKTVPDTTFLLTNLTALNTYGYVFMEHFGVYDTLLIVRPGCRIVNCPNE